MISLAGHDAVYQQTGKGELKLLLCHCKYTTNVHAIVTSATARVASND